MADLNYKQVTLIFPNGEKFVTMSAMEPNEYLLDIDFRNHPAWSKKGVSFINEKASKVADFNKKFAGFSSMLAENKEDENK